MKDLNEPHSHSKQHLSIVRGGRRRYHRQLTSVLGKFAAKLGLFERRNDERVPARELTASYRIGAEERKAKVKNVSPTGLYLLTKDRWIPGTDLELNLESGRRRHNHPWFPLRIQARVVRLGEDGAGLAFLNQHVDTAGWLELVSKAASLAPENNAVLVFRMAKALAYLLRISPFAEDRILRLFGELLSRDRVERALEIAIRADEVAASKGYELKTGVYPGIIHRILVDGSKAGDEPMQKCWAGLLAASSASPSDDEEILKYAGLLSRLEEVHTHILRAAVVRASPKRCDAGITYTKPIECTMAELKHIAKSSKLDVIVCALNRLFEFGLLELTEKPFGFEPLAKANLTPTDLGVEFCTRCEGDLDVLEQIDCSNAEVAS
jgi:hypothetical protein